MLAVFVQPVYGDLSCLNKNTARIHASGPAHLPFQGLEKVGVNTQNKFKRLGVLHLNSQDQAQRKNSRASTAL